MFDDFVTEIQSDELFEREYFEWLSSINWLDE